MNRKRKADDDQKLRIPHLCGDEPISTDSDKQIKEYSPLVWG